MLGLVDVIVESLWRWVEDAGEGSLVESSDEGGPDEKVGLEGECWFCCVPAVFDPEGGSSMAWKGR